MAVTFNAADIAAVPFGVNAKRQRMLTKERVSHTNILLDRVTLGARGVIELDIPPQNLVWFQMLEGESVLTRPDGVDTLSGTHVVFLPPGFRGTLATEQGAVLLYAEVPDAGRFDAGFAANPPKLRMVDWSQEPLLNSEHDARKRIYMVTPKLFGTRAIKGEMIIYPPGTTGANHHHEGAEHFMYVTRGRGTTYANESPLPVRKGDVIHYEDRERHYLTSEGDEEMVFVEFFVPGEYKTVWVPGAPVCTWHPTGRNIRGEKPSREIKAHGGNDVTAPSDV